MASNVQSASSQRQLDPEVARELKRLLPKGEVLTDEALLGVYATDASVFQFTPLAIVTPRHRDDIAAVLRVARERGLPVLPRGGGTSLAGQATNTAIILDFSKYLNRVLTLDVAARRVRVEPGLVRDELNAKLARHGLEFAPETSTSNRAVIGGMIANNSSGMRSIRYKRTIDHLLAATVVLASGDIVEMVDRTPAEARALAKEDTPEGRLWAGVIPIVDGKRALIEARFPKVMRRVGGYSLDEFPPDGPWNLAKLIGGSEGTLGLLLDATLNLVEKPRHIGVVAVHYDDMHAALSSTPAILKHDPLSVELVDSEVLRLAQQNPMTRALASFVVGQPEAILATELTGDSPEDLKRRMDALVADLRGQKIGYAWPMFDAPADCAQVIELRKQGLGILLGMRGDLKPIPFIEDACVPPDRGLADYIRRAREIVHRRGLRTVLFGHASVGVVHLRPVMNLKDPEHVAKMDGISHEVMELVREYGGSWSGEHGDGISRGAQNAEFWGPEIIDAFRAVKRAFDPQGLMNPGRVFDTPRMDQNLRYGGDYRVKTPETYFRFGAELGFDRAVEMCNGVGACRKTLGGTMCPSYMATRDEKDTTRGRANALRLAMSGQLGPEGVVGEGVHEVLDLCLECKACKTECPSSVDMAKMKSEHLAHYQDVYGRSLRSRIFADYALQGRLLSGPLAPLANLPIAQPWVRRLLFPLLGIAPQRRIPTFATRTFASLVRAERLQERRETGREEGGGGLDLRRVALFADCFTNYSEPTLGMAALRLLERLGYRVDVVAGSCCQRTRISKGFLREARRDGARTIDRLGYYALRGVPILGLEPSCVSSFADDLPDLVPNRRWAAEVARATMPVEEFLAKEVAAGRLKWPGGTGGGAPNYLVHGHCHQKSLFSTSQGRMLLGMSGNGAGKPRVEEVDSGCCGMAGSFGYEREHYELSLQIGDQRLLPAVASKGADWMVVANGFSCRHQIAETTGRAAVHVVEALARAVV